ncbi:HAD hydrolase family protein [Paenibacillus senegalensis]|nr:HAD hydrolase family protein [Paenibacillus senegalensis]
MSNAPEEIRQAADEVTGHQDDNGVAQVIYKYIL